MNKIKKIIEGDLIFETDDGVTWRAEFDQILQWLKNKKKEGDLTNDQKFELTQFCLKEAMPEWSQSAVEVNVYTYMQDEFSEWSWYRHEPGRKFLVGDNDVMQSMMCMAKRLKKELNLDVSVRLAKNETYQFSTL